MVRFLSLRNRYGTDVILEIGHQLAISGVKRPNGGRLRIFTNDMVSIIDLRSESNETCAVLFNQTFPEGNYLVNMTLLPTTNPSLSSEVRLTDIS